MPKVARVVIDTNIVRAIGAAPSEHSEPLLASLEAIRTSGLRLVTTSELNEEWQKHMPANGLFLEWHADMISRRLVGRRVLKTLDTLTRRLRRTVPRAACEAVEKDAHLAAVAVETNARMLSMDDRMRGHLSRASVTVEELRPVLWVNPSAPVEQVPEWLLHGAEYVASRTLGAYSARRG